MPSTYPTTADNFDIEHAGDAGLIQPTLDTALDALNKIEADLVAARGADASVAAALNGLRELAGAAATVEALEAAVTAINNTIDELAQSVESSSALALALARAPDPDDTGFDIIVLAGQSNQMGADATYSAALDPADGRVFQFPSSGPSANKIISATEPLAHWTILGVGPGLPFARWYAGIAPSNRKVLLVPVAYNATGFENGVPSWKTSTSPAGQNLYELAITQTLAALAAAGSGARVAAVLWVQGETDAAAGATVASHYQTNFDALIDGLRTRLGDPNLPFVVGQMNYPANVALYAAQATTINAVHVETPSRKLRSAFVAAPGGTDNGDNLHFAAAQQRTIGKNMVAGYRRAIFNTLGVAPIAPSGLTLTQSGTTVAAAWTAPLGRATDYNLRYRSNGGAWSNLTRTASAGTTASITGLALGATVDVQARTVNEEGVSAWSDSATLTLATVPGQVTGLVAGSPGTTSQPFTWTPTPGATIYTGWYKAASSGTWLAGGTSTTPAMTFTGLSPSTTYEYQVTAGNAAGTGPPSATVTAASGSIAFLVTDVGVAASRAYSLARRVVSGYAGAACRVRRSNDNAEQDIGFVNDLLDTASLLTFAGANSAYVTTIYDQSGNAVNVSQATTTKQPRIVNAGVLDTLNGQPGALFDGTDDVLFNTTPSLYAAGAASLVAIFRATGTGVLRLAMEARSATTPGRYGLFGVYQGNKGSFEYFNDAGAGVNIVSAGTKTLTDVLHQASAVDNGASIQHWSDAVSLTGPTAYTRAATTVDRFLLGAGMATGVYNSWFGGIAMEVVTFIAALTTGQRQAAEANQKLFYGTP